MYTNIFFSFTEFWLPEPHPCHPVYRRWKPNLRLWHQRSQPERLRYLCVYISDFLCVFVGRQRQSIVLTCSCSCCSSNCFSVVLFFTVQHDTSTQTRIHARRGFWYSQMSVRPVGQLDGNLVGKRQPGTVASPVQWYQRRVHESRYSYLPNGSLQLNHRTKGICVQKNAEIRFQLAWQWVL